MIRFNRILISCVLLLGFTSYALLQRVNRLKDERDTYRQNTDALLSEVKRMKIDSTTTAVDVKTLRLTLNEYKQYRAEDARKIESLGVRLKNLQAAGKHELEVKAPIKAEVRDTVVFRDTVALRLQKIEMKTPYLSIDGVIEGNELTGKIFLPVNLYQAVWVEHRHRFLWWQWGVKAIHQTIGTDNPHVEVKYSEMVEIR